MEKAVIVAALGLIVAACSPPAEQAASAPAAEPVNVLENVSVSRWSVRNATVRERSFALAANGTAAVSNREHPVSAGDVYRAEVTIDAAAPGALELHLTEGCGAEQADRTVVSYAVQPGRNTLRAVHIFQRPAGCARLTIRSPNAPLSIEIAGARMTRGN